MQAHGQALRGEAAGRCETTGYGDGGRCEDRDGAANRHPIDVGGHRLAIDFAYPFVTDRKGRHLGGRAQQNVVALEEPRRIAVDLGALDLRADQLIGGKAQAPFYVPHRRVLGVPAPIRHLPVELLAQGRQPRCPLRLKHGHGSIQIRAGLLHFGAEVRKDRSGLVDSFPHLRLHRQATQIVA